MTSKTPKNSPHVNDKTMHPQKSEEIHSIAFYIEYKLSPELIQITYSNQSFKTRNFLYFAFY